ncbi:MAG: DUF2934 domain-containing protein [Pseudomonadota bacterium]|nr:DUF2934 domain-containing protein [Pseudomonadota bacterium]
MTALPPRHTYNFNPLRFCVSPSMPDDERRRRIATAAYFKAAARGFAPGYDTEDWLAAEAELDGKLKVRP